MASSADMLNVKTKRKLRKENFWMMLKRSRNFMIDLYHKKMGG